MINISWFTLADIFIGGMIVGAILTRVVIWNARRNQS